MNRPWGAASLAASGFLVPHTPASIFLSRSAVRGSRAAQRAAVRRRWRQRAPPPLARSRPGSRSSDGGGRWNNENRLAPGGRSEHSQWMPDTETSFLHSIDLSSTPQQNRPPAPAPPWQQALATKMGKLQYQYCELVVGAGRGRRPADGVLRAIWSSQVCSGIAPGIVPQLLPWQATVPWPRPRSQLAAGYLERPAAVQHSERVCLCWDRLG